MQDNVCKLFGGGLPLRTDIEKRKTDEPGTAAAEWEQIQKGPAEYQIFYWISAATQSDLIYQLNALVSFRFYINGIVVSKLRCT